MAQLDGGEIPRFRRCRVCPRTGRDARIFNPNEPALTGLWLAPYAQIAAQVDQVGGEGAQKAARHLVGCPALGHAAQIERDARRQCDRSRLRLKEDLAPASTSPLQSARQSILRATV